MTAEKKRYINRPQHAFFNSFIMIFVIIGMLLAGSITVIYNLESKDYLKRIMSDEKHSLALQQKIITNNFNQIFADLLFLSGQNELMQFLEQNNPAIKKKINNEYLEFCKHKAIYDQIRFIDEEGMESARVNFNNGNPEIVPEKNLQLKRNRYYFEDTFVLDRGQIFVSPLDLNVEEGKIEMPLKPMIRFGTPVFDSDGNNRGVIVLNYLAAHLIEAIKSVSDISIGRMMLINRDGFWLAGPSPEDEWGFMYKDRAGKKFGNLYPKAWRTISDTHSHQLFTGQGIFTTTTIYPLGIGDHSSTGSGEAFSKSKEMIVGRGYYWKLVSFVPKKSFNSATRGLLLKLFAMGSILFLLGSIPSYLIAKAIVRRRRHKMELIYMANYDKLTQLPNRALFMDRLNQIINQSMRYKRLFALLFIDLDGFKAVNDSMGHDGGDELLAKTARRLSGVVRRSDTVARLGGDEFTVILSLIKTNRDAELVAQKIIHILSEPFDIRGKRASIGASIGISLFIEGAETAEALIKRADDAMYSAKKRGKNRWVLDHRAS